MKLAEKLSRQNPQQIWDEYCGFLALDLEQYMHIQNRLLEEQTELWCSSELGRRILNGKQPHGGEEFLRTVPLTGYDDYADILLQRRDDMLPAPPVTWVETTWEGGKRPIKVAPYSQGVMDTFRRNSVAIMLLASATDWAQYDIGEKVLSGLAPLPFLTGLMGLILDQEFHFISMPPRETTTTMSFSDRTKLGFKMALSSGIDYFFGLGSISYYISRELLRSGSGGSHSSMRLPALWRIARGKLRAREQGREMLPKDLFKLKGFICAGTDNACYKDDLEQLWGTRPMELFAGTECGLVGTETWNRKDLYFFPDVCYYEFIPGAYVRSNERYLPTVTMDGVQVNEEYELVITTFKGGAFARYRSGDMYRCTGIGESNDHSALPRFRYIDRVSTIIDIAGFTRITENSINEVIALSHLPIENWCAAKEYDKDTRHPFLHLFVELQAAALAQQAISEELLRSHLEIYFTYMDSDYKNLKRILGMEPLQISFLRIGTFEEYALRAGAQIEKINPSQMQLRQLLKTQQSVY